MSLLTKILEKDNQLLLLTWELFQKSLKRDMYARPMVASIVAKFEQTL